MKKSLPVPDTGQAVEFLQHLYPTGPFHLVAIREGKPLEAQSFDGDEDQVQLMRTWIDERQGESNLYFHVNELRHDFKHAKAKKEDVRLAHFIHVDIDDAGALEAIQSFSPRPTVVVFSGGGYQVFWKLEVASEDLERVERVNLALAGDLGGDNCHNIDRIMRLPGTVNVLSTKKRAAGRKPALAYMVRDLSDWSRTYPLDAFPERPPDPQSPGGVAMAVPSNVPAHVDIGALPATVLPIIRKLIELGDDPGAPLGSAHSRYRSRSEAVFRVACDLTQAGCAVETILSILLDPAYGISASVRDKSNPMREAMRKIAAANEAMSVGWPDTDRAGRPRPTYRNTVVAIRRLRLVGDNDEFHRRKSMGGAVMQVFQGDLSDDSCAIVRSMIIDQFQFDPGKSNVLDAANFVCLENTHHPIRAYLSGLVWDGVPRLDTWLIKYLSAEDTPLNRTLSKIVLLAAIRRIREPGVKFDQILVLEGPQGTGKSTAIRILAGDDNFSDQDILTLDAKQQMEAMEGIWFFEISELAGLNRGETNKVKAFASRQIDRGRPAYGHFRENRPRQTIFIGTTNEEQYLRDTSGNRRFSPVKTGAIDLEGLSRDRDQLFAEAAAVESAGASITLPTELWNVASKEQEKRMEDHPWQDTLSNVAGEVTGDVARISTAAIFGEFLKIDPERRQQFQEKLIASLMRKLGWTGPKRVRFRGDDLRGYERPAIQADEEYTKLSAQAAALSQLHKSKRF